MGLSHFCTLVDRVRFYQPYIKQRAGWQGYPPRTPRLDMCMHMYSMDFTYKLLKRQSHCSHPSGPCLLGHRFELDWRLGRIGVLAALRFDEPHGAARAE